jgi:serine/threonine protein kinase/tetratricopeptide (TPR) repeat protein
MSHLPATGNGTMESLVGRVADEFIERLDRGEQPDIEELARRHPEAAAVLRQVLQALQLVRLSGPPSGASGLAAAAEAPVTGVLGDFRIVREVGRGAMGVVYEAVQVSLGRRVAVKVLPLAAALDARQLQRFKNEAQAAAHLLHQHIVPVYAVGYERGVHYYAMQFIDGHTLAALIHQLRQRDGLGPPTRASATASASEAILPATEPYVSEAAADTASRPAAALSTEHSGQSPAFFRTAARLGAQAAEALEHAHQLGVVHRDVKPANLLLDGRGELWVTDFGLAHCQSQAGLTLTGDLVGTLRYMSPEQALAQQGGVDHRTDVYSLGATLYELLTLEPVFDGRDRQELLRQIAFAEPRPPRKLNPALPGELETIVLKALGKDPAERYATAQELADDLGRYLRDEPIRAKRPTRWQRLKKWSRRHRGAVVFAVLAGALLLVSSVAILAVSNVAIERERRAATRQRDDAQVQRQLARRAVDKMYTQVAERWLSQQPQLEPLQREFLEEALHFYQEFGEEQGAVPELRLETGNAYRRVGEIQEKLGELSRAEEALNRAIALLEQLAADFPHEPRYRAVLASSHLKLGALFRRRVQFAEAEKELKRSLLLHKTLVAERPGVAEYELELSFSCAGLASVWLGEGRDREAADGCRQALSLLRKLPPDLASRTGCRRHQAGCTLGLGLALAADGRRREAEALCRQAALLLDRVVKDFPRDPGARHDLARALWSLCGQLPERFSPEAETLLRRALVITGQLTDDYPRVPDYRGLATMCQARLGQWLHEHGRFREAEEAFSQAFDCYEKLVAEVPCLPGDGLAQIEVWLVLRPLVLESGRYREAEQTVRKVLALAERLAVEFPGIDRFPHLAALSHDTLGLVLGEVGRPEEAEKAFREASAIWSELVKKGPARQEYRHWLAWSHNDLADLLATGPAAQYRDPPRAVQLAQKAVELHPQYGGFWNTLGTAHYRAGDYRAAVTELEKAMAMNRGGDCYDWFFLAMAHRRLGHEAEARDYYDRAVAWMAENQRKLERSKLQAARFRRFRAEAAALLCVEGSSTTTSKEVPPRNK